ncbi:hypothetical protein [Falsiroseomonas selenitidurans]|uniref:Glycosyltransferase RgtA/B/C/D-like domain-containing protein n=1 Tax=Falsiroseomonas selenitidurans TaxID=2716335 RepID=A0ABX1E4C1_9PROT|nr:hypothetical protein [Falsiroseomonas selenitidurans]NKC31931.1 hypothetical protein [Falsiroseomonas selenitidurans]
MAETEPLPRAAAGTALRVRLLRALALLPALGFLLMALTPPLNHDVAAILNFAERWVAGESLFRELIDVNPPLIFALAAIPALIARVAPLDIVQAWLLCVVLCCALAWRMCLRLREGFGEGVAERTALDALVPLVIVMVAYDVGQREHLMGLFALPYALLAARRAERMATPTGLALAVTIAAALGFALKPHFLAVPALVEALVLLRVGPAAALRDRLPWVMLGVWLLYLASLPVFFADYLGFVVPLVMDYYLANGGIGLFGVLLTNQLGPALFALVVLLPLLAWRGAGWAPRMLGAVGLGAFLSAWVQHKGWSYHVVPMAMPTALMAGWLAARWLDRMLPAGRAAAAAPGIALALVLAVSAVHLRGESPWRQIWYGVLAEGRLTATLKREVAGERLLVLSPDIYPVYPALNYARARSTLRTMNLWLLVGAYPGCPEGAPRYREPWEMSRPEFLVYRTVAEDFARAPPAGVLVAKNSGIPRCGAEDFDPIAYFSRHPAFAEGWRHYTRVVHMDTYLLYLRED